MSILLTAIAITSGCVFLFYFLISLRACTVGSGFTTVGDLVGVVLILGVSAALALWLGPIGLAGLGIL